MRSNFRCITLAPFLNNWVKEKEEKVKESFRSADPYFQSVYTMLLSAGIVVRGYRCVSVDWSALSVAVAIAESASRKPDRLKLQGSALL